MKSCWKTGLTLHRYQAGRIRWIPPGTNMEPGKNMKSRILLIDDDRSVTRLLSRVFLKHEFEVIVANNGPEGIQLAREQGPEAIILDLSLPQLNGWQVCREIRRFSNAPIVIYSGNTDPNTKDSILAEGANCFLAKPAPLNELVAAVQGAVG